MKQVMIDIETLGTRPGCVLLEIGIIANYQTPGVLSAGKADFISQDGYAINLVVDITQQKGKIHANTLKWWMRKPEAFAAVCARQSLAEMTPYAICLQLQKIIAGADEVWANSPGFDCAILNTFMFNHAKIEQGIPFWKERDFRTVRALNTDVEWKAPEDAHSALADADAQVVFLRRCGVWDIPEIEEGKGE